MCRSLVCCFVSAPLHPTFAFDLQFFSFFIFTPFSFSCRTSHHHPSPPLHCPLFFSCPHQNSPPIITSHHCCHTVSLRPDASLTVRCFLNMAHVLFLLPFCFVCLFFLFFLHFYPFTNPFVYVRWRTHSSILFWIFALTDASIDTRNLSHFRRQNF
uniref:Uncharacterized protein n=1 Tax=Trypanosoma vivax (strain Y486) TaxID=1055687 RepID=G0U110_TRYVY|nr:hypothetical protein TVY486_0803730 [Trypanosoma vivax Y486]